MPLTLACPCGKTLKVKDELAGKRVKCPGCGGVLAVPEPLAELEPLEEEAELEPLDDPPAPAASETGTRAAAKKKKKKKKKARGKSREDVDREFDEWVQKNYWRKRLWRGAAFVAFGLIIIGGSTYLLVRHSEDVKPYQSILLLLIGVGAVGKGLLGLFFGQFFEDE